MKTHLLHSHFLTLITLVFCLPLFSQNSVNNDETVIYGFRPFQVNVTNYIAGPIWFKAGNPADIHLIADQTSLGRIYAGEYYHYNWYAMTTVAGTQSGVENFVTIDINTGNRTVIAQAPQVGQLHDMAYDYSSDKMYAIRTTSYCTFFYTIDLKTGAATPVNGDENAIYDIYMLTLACDLNGQLYCIATDNNLYKINKNTLEYSLIGDTGAEAAFTQSMGFDHNTGILYWCNAGDHSFYTVDLTTGNATLIGELGQADNITSMFVKYINVPIGTPDRVENLTAISSPTGENSTLIKWTNPSLTAQGILLETLTGIKIYRDNELIHTISNPVIGQESIFTDNEGLVTGLHTYKIVPFNISGDGAWQEIKSYSGFDRPGPVSNIKLEATGTNGKLSWEAPQTSQYGGAYQPDDLQGYKIQRKGSENIITLPANVTQYTDTELPGWGFYSYSIQAFNSIGEGEISDSPTVLLNAEGMIIMQEGTFEINEGTFYDTGGPENTYHNNERITMTLKPAVENGKVRVLFDMLDIEDYDLLSIYNGPDVNSPLIGEFNGTIVPEKLEEITGDNSSGSLTFHFDSDVMGAMEGWEARVKCIVPKDKDLRAGKLKGNLFPSQNQTYEYTLTLINEGLQDCAGTSFKVYLLDSQDNILSQSQGVDIAAGTTKNVKLEYTPDLYGKHLIYGYIEYEADDDISNNKGKELLIEIQAEGSAMIMAGNGQTFLTILPINLSWNYSMTQTLYPASILGNNKGIIKEIRYPANLIEKIGNKPVKIWMGTTSKASLSEGWIPLNELIIVKDGMADFHPGEYEMAIPLDTPFDYNKDNLVIAVYYQSVEDYYSYMNNFNNTSTDGIILSRAESSETPIDIENLSTTYTDYSYMPNTRIFMDLHQEKFTVIIKVIPNGAGIVTGAKEYKSGETAVITAEPAENYKFLDLEENGKIITTELPYSFVVNRNFVLTAIFDDLNDIDNPIDKNAIIYSSGKNIIVEIPSSNNGGIIEIIDTTGKKIKKSNISSGQKLLINIDMEGVYIVRFITGNSVTAAKVIIK